MKKTLLILLFCALYTSILAQVPANNEVGFSVNLTVTALGLPTSPVAGTTVNATTTTSPPVPTVPSACGCSGSVSSSPNDVWYSFNTGNFPGFQLNVTSTPYIGAPGYVRIYQNIGPMGTPIACNCAPTSSMALGSWTLPALTANTTYYIAVSPKIGTNGFWGPFEISIQATGYPLQLDINKFDGLKGENKNIIHWEVDLDEKYSKIFLQRKNELETDYISIYSKDVSALKSTQEKYEDDNFHLGQNTYRLAVQSPAGDFTYSESIVLNNTINNELSIYPNPITGNEIIKVIRKHSGDMGKIELYNSIGLKMEEITLNQVQQIIPIEISSTLAKGVYYIKYTSSDDDYSIVKPWVKL